MIDNEFLILGVFDGELEKTKEVLAWLDDLLTGDDIEAVSFLAEAGTTGCLGVLIHLDDLDNRDESYAGDQRYSG